MPDPLPPTESMAKGLLKGRYLLGPELGRGGFAITYLAADLEVASRKVVVKVLNERRSGDSWSVKKFTSEMEALARIDHPNVVGVIDFGQSADGKPFLVMQYIPGRSLREMIPREGLPLAQVAQIIRQTGRALTAAHEAGVCHRDVKPENVMIPETADGDAQIKLIDFGLARVQTGEGDSQSSSVAGTHTYMAPEQFEGKSSVASDIYQMGVLAYELVTGIVPFRASSSRRFRFAADGRIKSSAAKPSSGFAGSSARNHAEGACARSARSATARARLWRRFCRRTGFRRSRRSGLGYPCAGERIIRSIQFCW